jgi:protein-S-isoprenylcysteine O-methyltransferase Ste14
MPPLSGHDPARLLIPLTLLAWGLTEAALRLRHWRRQGLLASARQPGLLGRLRPHDWTFPAIGAGYGAGFTLGWLATRLSWARIIPAGPAAGWQWLLWVAGELLAAGGIALRVWSIVTLDRFFTFVVRIQCGHTLVDHGPYRVLRHPAYAGALLVPLGTGVLLGNWLSVACVAGLPLAAIGARIGKEEAALAGALGAQYLAYASRTARLIPRIW